MSIEYLKLSTLARRYDMSTRLMKDKLKELDLTPGEHYVYVGGSIRYHAEKMHKKLICGNDEQINSDLLDRLLIG